MATLADSDAYIVIYEGTKGRGSDLWGFTQAVRVSPSWQGCEDPAGRREHDVRLIDEPPGANIVK